jgi:opacity protein-like surface antigen
MKKVLIALALVVLVLVPVSAASMDTTGVSQSKYAIGLNAGTNSGIGFQYRVNEHFDLIGNVGLNNFSFEKLAVDGALNFMLTKFEIEEQMFYVTIGAGAFVGIPLADGYGVDLSALVPVGLVYSFDEDVVPIDLYVRIAPGLSILSDGEFDLGFGFSGYFGALWRFD